MRGCTRRQAHTGATEQFAALRRLQAAPVLREVVAGLGRISRARRGRDPSQQEARAAPAIWLTRWARGARPSATLSLTCPAHLDDPLLAWLSVKRQLAPALPQSASDGGSVRAERS